MFIAAANALDQDKSNLGEGLLSGLKQMQLYGGARKGQRTMIDSLLPAFQALSLNKSLEEIAKNAREGAESTKKVVKTDFGRSSYVSEQFLEGNVDPGAESIARVFEALSVIKLDE